MICCISDSIVSYLLNLSEGEAETTVNLLDSKSKDFGKQKGLCAVLNAQWVKTFGM